jgi:hypothetical protein
MDWLENELRSLPVDERLNLLVDAIKHNQHAFNIQEDDALHSVIDMVATISNVARLLSRANRFHLSNLLMDASDRVVHLPPKNEVENS